MKSQVKILLVEDNELDVRMILHSAKKTKLNNNIHVVHDASAALEYLGQCTKQDLPNLILLDLSLPGINGLDFLGIIKNDKQFCALPVVVLTSSAAETDIKRAYENHAAAFITKPIEIEGFVQVVLSIDDFFFEIVSMPDRS